MELKFSISYLERFCDLLSQHLFMESLLCVRIQKYEKRITFQGERQQSLCKKMSNDSKRMSGNSKRCGGQTPSKPASSRNGGVGGRP